MTTDTFQIRQLADELQPPESGKRRIVLTDGESAKVVLITFAAGDGLAEHVAPRAGIIQVIKGEAELTVGDQSVAGKPGFGFRWQPIRPKESRPRLHWSCC